MRVQPTANKDTNKQDVFSRRRSPLPTIIAVLFALLIGGCLVLVIISQLLRIQSDLYVSVQSIAEAAAITEFMTDILALYLLCASLLLLLFLGSAALWAWKKTQSRLLRFGSLFLILLALAAIAAIWFRGAAAVPIP